MSAWPHHAMLSDHDDVSARGARSLLRAVLPLIGAALRRRHEGGRSADTDVLAELLIEDGEAELLLAWLDRDLIDAGSPFDPSPTARREIHDGLIGRVIDRFAVDATTEVALALALGVEVDSRFARVVGYLNDHPGHVRPTLGLVWSIAGTPLDPSRATLLYAPIVQDSVLEIVGEGPLSTREVRLAADLVPRLLGASDHTNALCVTTAGDCSESELSKQPIPEEALTWLGAARSGAVPPLVIEGTTGSGRTRLALHLFGALGLKAVSGSRNPRLLRREARLHGAGIIAEPEGDLRAWWQQLEGVAWPIAAVVSPEQGEHLRVLMSAEPITLRLGVPNIAERIRLWRASAVGPRLGPHEAAIIAARFPFTPGKIERAAMRAALEPWTDGSLAGVCREVAAASFGGLARRLPRVYRREDLVLPEQLEQEFALALSWVRNRQQVLGDWQLGRCTMNCWGLTMLLSGPPGTGKTMAAQVLARELDAEIYRVDLSQVVSKYIGETEKQLDALLTAAQQAGALLLFDEADVVFGRRSEVRDARDRYANLEVGFLLQRIEEHDGIVLLSTNRMGDMDDAFRRRFQFVLAFPLPETELRARILKRLLPWEACADGVDAALLADRFRLSGGELRNAVVAAAFLAASEGAKLDQSHLLKALRREVLSSGRTLRAEERGDPPRVVDT